MILLGRRCGAPAKRKSLANVTAFPRIITLPCGSAPEWRSRSRNRRASFRPFPTSLLTDVVMPGMNGRVLAETLVDAASPD